MTTRRTFFRQLTILITGSASLVACSNEEQSNGTAKADPEQSRLDAFVDTIVPKDQDPGAVDAGVSLQLKKYLEKTPKLEKKAQMLFHTIDELATKNHNTLFSQLNLQKREKILRQIIKSSDKNDMAAKVVLHKLKRRIIKSFYKSEAAWKMLAFTAPYPAGYPDFNAPPPEI